MFNSNNLPKSLLQSVGKVLDTSKSEFNLPETLMEAAKVASKTISACKTIEQRHDLISKNFLDAVNSNNLQFDTKTVVSFERAVNYFSQN